MHGGDIYRHQVRHDFSVNVNPMEMPPSVYRALLDGVLKVGAYPDPMCEKLREKLAEHFTVSAEHILCGNGASELLMAICRWKMPQTALLLAPGFSGYPRALEAVGCKIEHFYLREEDGFALTNARMEALCEEISEKHPDILFLANPSNPTGQLVSKEQMILLATVCKNAGTILVLDECFMELTASPEKHSMVDALRDDPNLLILRAFTKSFSIPGARLGYLLCSDEEIAKEITRQLPEWNVSIPAQQAGIAALGDMEWLRESREVIARERTFLAEGLAAYGAKVYPSDANFLLFQWKKGNLYQDLLKQGILIRDCSDYEGLGEGYYRIAVKSHDENEQLIALLA